MWAEFEIRFSKIFPGRVAVCRSSVGLFLCSSRSLACHCARSRAPSGAGSYAALARSRSRRLEEPEVRSPARARCPPRTSRATRPPVRSRRRGCPPPGQARRAKDVLGKRRRPPGPSLGVLRVQHLPRGGAGAGRDAVRSPVLLALHLQVRRAPRRRRPAPLAPLVVGETYPPLRCPASGVGFTRARRFPLGARLARDVPRAPRIPNPPPLFPPPPRLAGGCKSSTRRSTAPCARPG